MFDCVSLVAVVVVVVSVAVVLSIVWCCSYPCWLLGHVLFGELCESSPAATRLTVYRRPQVMRPVGRSRHVGSKLFGRILSSIVLRGAGP